jgi:hypothetical protein
LSDRTGGLTLRYARRTVDIFPNHEGKLACGQRREIEPGIGQRIAKLEAEVWHGQAPET